MNQIEATPECNYAGYLVQRLGELSCLIDAATGETIHSSDLGLLISSFGASLLAAGLKGGDRIVICCHLSPASSVAYLGAMYAGLVPVPIEENSLPSLGSSLLEGTGAKAVWTEKSSKFDRIRGTKIEVLHGHPAEMRTDPIPPAPCKENDLATLVATSGSMGKPRFVMVSHGNLSANTRAIIRSQHLANDERAMLILPLSYCFGASVVHSHLCQGGSVVFDRRFMFPDKVLHAINQYACTTFAGVPTVYNILLRRSNLRSIRMPSLRRFLQAGGPLMPGHVSEMRAAVPTAKLYVMYGQTEATARISCLDPEHLDEKLGSVGRPLDNVAVRIVDPDGKDIPTGQVGEIIINGPSITLGYLNEPEATRRVFKDGWLQTGDLARLDEDGYIWVEGRKESFLKIRGVRVSFAEVESMIAALPGVYECAVTSVAHPEAGEALALYVVPDKEVHDVVDQVRHRLPATWTCDSINIVAEIPKSSRGKMSRATLSTQGRQSR